MNHYDDPMTERAIKAHLRRATNLDRSPLLPGAGASERVGNIVTLRNVNGTLARYKVGKRKATGAEFVRFID